MDLNQAVLSGRLTRDPELKQTPNGTSVCSFSIANNDGFGDNAKVYFFNVTAWKQNADFICKYLRKGNQIYLTGKWTQRAWEKDGKKNTVVEFTAFQVDAPNQKSSDSGLTEKAKEVFQGDDIPF